ncbi:MAG: insulinase family protein, partial [Burkholderiales bacterium]|nr:insulinase family protein [Burkholderiales bacterium]
MRNSRLHVCRMIAAALLLAAVQAHAILPIQHWETRSGARVYFVQNRDLPMFDLSVEFPAGAGFDSKEKAGLASMTSQLLRLGADGMDEDEIARRMADVGAVMSSQFDTDRAGLSLRTLSSAAERRQALEVYARVLQRPTFPEAVLEREKSRRIAVLKEADTRPDTIATRTFYRLVYRDHPYALRSSGEVETVGRLTREDLLDFYRRHYVADEAVVALIGDLSREEAEAIAERVTSGLGRSAGAGFELPPVEALPAGSTHVVAHPASQSHIYIGAPGVRRGDPDYFPLFVGNHILGGGGFVSRITEEVRQKRGLAYSAYSYFSPLRQPGPFLIGMQTQRDQAQEALAVVRKTLRDFIAEGPLDKELVAAKQNIIGGFPLRIDSNRKIP